MTTFQEYEVGKYYLVPCVHIDVGDRWCPILLPCHEDMKIIGFFKDHYHEDPRFLNEREYQKFSFLRVVTGPLLETLGPVSFRLRKCKRAMPAYSPFVYWHSDLMNAYANAQLKNGICPHKGIDLTTCPVVDDVVTCPGHGLRWNVKTGQLVK